MVFFPARRSVSFTAVGHDGSWDWATTDGNFSPTATIFSRVGRAFARNERRLIVRMRGL